MRIGVVHHRHDEVFGDVHDLPYRSTPCSAPMRSSTATNTSSGVLPAPAPSPATEPSMRFAPASRRRASWRRPWPCCGGRGSRAPSPAAARAQRAQARGHVIGQHVARGVGDVDAVRAVASSMNFACFDSASGVDHVRHHQEADGVEPELARHADVLAGDVRLGAVRRDADGVDAAVERHLQVVDGADARQQQRGDLRPLHPESTARRYSSSVCAGKP